VQPSAAHKNAIPPHRRRLATKPHTFAKKAGHTLQPLSGIVKRFHLNPNQN
jgi:hypothetical protein